MVPAPQGRERRHHYVWQHLLRGWGSDGRIWCRLPDGQRKNVPIDSIAFAWDFYRVDDITVADQFVARKLIEQLPNEFHQSCLHLLSAFVAISEFRRQRRESDSPEEGEVAASNFEENLHAHFEGEAIPLIDALRNEDRRPLDQDEEARPLYFFLVDQWLRTPGAAAHLKEANTKFLGRDLPATRGPLRMILTHLVADRFWGNRGSLGVTFLRAGPNTEFITGGQPIINSYVSNRPPGTAVESVGQVELYFPLSAALAVLLDFRGWVTVTRELTDSETLAYNGMIATTAHGQLYAASEAALVAVEAVIGQELMPSWRAR